MYFLKAIWDQINFSTLANEDCCYLRDQINFILQNTQREKKWHQVKCTEYKNIYTPFKCYILRLKPKKHNLQKFMGGRVLDTWLFHKVNQMIIKRYL